MDDISKASQAEMNLILFEAITGFLPIDPQKQNQMIQEEEQNVREREKLEEQNTKKRSFLGAGLDMLQRRPVGSQNNSKTATFKGYEYE